jgi:serine/threonine protein kinase
MGTKMEKNTSHFEDPIMGGELRLKPGTLIKRRYRIEEKIGEGGCGTVFRAIDTLLNTRLALKFLNPAVITGKKKFLRVTREINLARKITDERIVKVFALEKWNSLYFLVMELVEGKSLKDIFEEKKRLGWEEFKPIYFEVLKGIKVLHQHNIIHRDIKPSNIIVSEQDKIKILDFGLAKEINDREKTSSVGEIVGSPYYMSPEQASGEELDFRSDIFSLGMILYRALTGKHPLEKYRTLEIIHNHMQGKPIKLASMGRDIPGFIRFAIKKAVEKKNRRFGSIEEILRVFRRGQTRVRDWFAASLSRKPLRITTVSFLLAVLLTFLYIITNIKTDPASIVNSIETKGSILFARNNSGVELWQKDFEPFIITHAYLDFHKSYHNPVMVLLKHPQNNSFSPTVSLNSLELDNRIVYLDNKGKEILNQSFIEAAGIETYDFAKISKITHIERKDIDNDGKEETIFATHHSRGMYPNALCILDEGELFAFSHPGHMDFYQIIEANNKTITFIAAGQNNIFSHLGFFSEISLNRQNKLKVKGFPYFGTPGNDMIDEFMVFLPRGATIDNIININWKNGSIMLSDYRGGNKIGLNKDYSLGIRNEMRNYNKIYKDNPGNLKKVYRLINKCYKEKNLNNNLDAAYSLILEASNYKVENPYLKSALYYFKGDLEILLGRYKEGEKNLLKALDIHPDNNDPTHRICEIEFLKGNPLKAIEKVENQYPRAKNFWGLGKGHLLFKSYCYLQVGMFEEARVYFPQIVDRAHQKSAKCFEGMAEIFTGNYQKAFSDLEIFEKEFVYTLTVLELRLLISRARILAEKRLERSRFYFEDILAFSKTKKHLAAISAAYFQAKDGKTSEAQKIAEPAFETLLKLAKGDFETRLWLFYDAYMYGKTMELCGNKNEAIRGFRECIKANPYTDLAQKSTASLQHLDEL